MNSELLFEEYEFRTHSITTACFSRLLIFLPRICSSMFPLTHSIFLVCFIHIRTYTTKTLQDRKTKLSITPSSRRGGPLTLKRTSPQKGPFNTATRILPRESSLKYLKPLEPLGLVWEMMHLGHEGRVLRSA